MTEFTELERVSFNLTDILETKLTDNQRHVIQEAIEAIDEVTQSCPPPMPEGCG